MSEQDTADGGLLDGAEVITSSAAAEIASFQLGAFITAALISLALTSFIAWVLRDRTDWPLSSRVGLGGIISGAMMAGLASTLHAGWYWLLLAGLTGAVLSVPVLMYARKKLGLPAEAPERVVVEHGQDPNVAHLDMDTVTALSTALADRIDAEMTRGDVSAETLDGLKDIKGLADRVKNRLTPAGGISRKLIAKLKRDHERTMSAGKDKGKK